MRLTLVSFPFLVLLGLVSSTWASTTVLNDTFDSPSYISFSFNEADSLGNPDDVSFEIFVTTNPTGGNPDAFGVFSHFHDVSRDEFDEPLNGDGFTSVQSFFSDQTTSYTPSLEGEILSITFSLDLRTSYPFDSLFFEVSDVNGGSVANGGSGFLTVTSDGEWYTYTLADVTQSGLSSRDFAGSDPLSFGFGFTSSADVFFGSEEFFIDVDNFVVTVTPVPEVSPVVMLLSAMSVAGLGLLRRRSV